MARQSNLELVLMLVQHLIHTKDTVCLETILARQP